jgi:ABC-type antimicrobial peptide transport system permease subunit
MLGDTLFPTADAVSRARYPVRRLLALPFPVRNLVRRWRGMVGMIVGMGISLALVMTIQAASKANVDIFTIDFLRSGADLYVIQEGGTLIPVLPSDTPGNIEHGRHVLSQVRGMPGVEAAFGLMTWSMVRERPGPRRRDQPTELVAAIGVEGDPLLVPGAVALKEGRWLRRGSETVIGSKLAREKGLRVGDSLRLNNRDFLIVGIGKLRGAGFGADSVAYLDYRAFRERAQIGDVFNVIAVRTREPETTRARILELRSLAVFDRQQLVRRAEEVNANALVLYWTFNGMALAIGALFITNMLTRAVAERRLEFATLRAIGIPSRTILVSVTSEAVLITAVAGVLGIALSLFLGWWMNTSLAPAYGYEFFYTADPATFALVFVLGLGVGVVSGLIPARQATRVDPAEVLREA